LSKVIIFDSIFLLKVEEEFKYVKNQKWR